MANKTWILALPVLAAASPAWAQAPDPTDTWADESSWDIPGEYVVDFDDDTEESAIGSYLTSLGLTFEETELEDETRVQIVQVEPHEMDELDTLRSDARVEGVEPLARVKAFFVPDDPYFAKQWHLSRIGAEQGWSYSTGRGVTVAVIDTGIACEAFDQFHRATDLAETKCVEGKSFVRSARRPNDDHGHGTHVAGTIAQSTNNGLGAAGLAFRARLMPVKVLSADGWGTTAGVADGIRWAADNGAQVINLSLGSPRNSSVLQKAIDHARSRGVIVVAAAGNTGRSVGYPGASEGVIGVSASDANDGLAWFSSRGKGVDVAAPGVNVLQQTICNRGRGGCETFAAFNGTSMASPHVAAAAALLVSLGVNDPLAVEAILTDTARTVDDSDAGRQKYGAGILDAGAAARRTVLIQTGARLLALLAGTFLAFRLARRGGAAGVSPSAGYWLGALVTGVGLLFFAPLFLSRDALWVELLSRPLGDWDLLVGSSIHRFLPLANIAVPLGLSAILLRVKGAQGLLGGLAVGTAAYLASVAVLGQLSTPFGWLVTTLWCGANAAASLWLGALLLRKS
jgi:serine protease